MLTPTHRPLFYVSVISLVFAVGFNATTPINSVIASSNTLITAFDSNAWTGVDGTINAQSDYTKAPFKIQDGDFEFLYSAGVMQNSEKPVLGSLNSDMVVKHNFNDATLTSFRQLKNNMNTIIVLNTPLLKTRVTSLTFSYDSKYGYQEIYFIYSHDDGVSWQLDATSVRNTDQGTTHTFTSPIAGLRLKVGILTHYVTIGYRYIRNPKLSIAYESIAEVEESQLLETLVSEYSPCATDTLGLKITNVESALSLLRQYQSLSSSAKTTFDQAVMSDGTRHRSRLEFIVSNHQLVTSSIEATKATNQNEMSMLWLWFIPFMSVIIYAITRIKRP